MTKRNNRKRFRQNSSGLPLFSHLFCVIFSLAIGCKSSTAADNPVRSASELDYPPFSIVRNDGSADGFSVELMRAALAAMGRKVVFTVGPWGTIKQDLEQGRLDALPLVGRSPEREAIFDFTVPYLRLYGAVFVRKDEDGIKTPQDLKGRRVGVMQGDNAEEFMRRRKLTDRLVTTRTFEEAMQKLAAGKLDAVVVQRLVGLNLIERLQLDNLKTAIAPLQGLRQDFCFAVTEGDKGLLALLNEGLMVVMADGTYEHLRTKWMGILDRKERQRTQLLKGVAGATSLLALFLMLLYIYQIWKTHRSLKERVKKRTAELEIVNSALQKRSKELSRVNDQLSQQQIFFEAVLENIQDGIVACDRHGILTLFNKSTRKFHGIGEKSIPPDQWAAHYNIYSADGVTLMRKEEIPLFRAFCGEVVQDQEMVIAPEHGRRRTLLASGQVMHDRNGRKLGAVVSMHDITDTKNAEAALRKERDAAEAANLAKSIFLANMSHELRTPLNAILGFSEMLAKDPQTTGNQQEKLTIINRSGAHLLAMINDILDLSKIEAGRTELDPEPFELPRLLEEIGEMMRSRARSKNLIFSLEIAPKTQRFVNGDAGKLRQILINLLGNAVKFTDKGGVVLRARTVAQGQRLRLELEIEDTGPGILPKDMEAVFKPFFQAGSGRDSKGTGLGLAISRSFAKLMGGSIEAQSSIGKGSIFQVSVCLSPAQAEAVTTAQTWDPEVIRLAEGQPEQRILIVEDNPDNRLLLTTLLTQVGFSVREALNGEEAVVIFQQWHPHFIWMDIRMPVLDGYEATRRIRALPGKNIPIVALTASAFRQQHRRILAAGCDEVVHKPFRSSEVFSVMEKYLGVRYIYKEELESRTAEPRITVTAAMMDNLSPEQQERLGRAAQKLDIAKTEEVIKEIRRQYPETGKGLLILAREFHFGRILELLNRTKDRAN